MTRVRDIWAVVPVKRFTQAKQRLADVLDGPCRGRLARAMLEDVLDLLAQLPELAGILVVTADAEAARIAEMRGACVLEDLQENGTNDAVWQGMRHLAAEGRGGMLVLHADVPFADPTELRAAIAQAEAGRVVLASAHGDPGTNLLVAIPPDAINPCFGPGSLLRHIQEARRSGLDVKTLALAGVGHDIDRPADLEGVPLSCNGQRTRALLASLSIQSPPNTKGASS